MQAPQKSMAEVPLTSGYHEQAQSEPMLHAQRLLTFSAKGDHTLLPITLLLYSSTAVMLN